MRREELGLTLREAAEQLGCSKSVYDLWEKGAYTPNGARLERIREWLDVDAATLLQELAESKLA